MIRGVLFASIGLHVAVIAALPDVRPFAARPSSPAAVIEIASEPPPPRAEPTPLAALPSPSPSPAPSPPLAPPRGAARVATAAAALGTTGEGVALPAADTTDIPADFTGTVLSNAPPASTGVVAAASPPLPPPPTPPAPRFVPASALSRRPGAPFLDAALERNYPVEARRAGISGQARLRIQILADGRVGKVERLSESSAGFGDACARTVQAARWEPPLDHDGRPVATEITYVCKFEVRS